jgi:hypothetical protein
MRFSSGNAPGRRATPVSADDVARVVTRAFSERTSRIRLTSGQRRAILDGPCRPGRATG